MGQQPPGIFALYAAAVRVVGESHAALGLDLVAAAASALLAARLLRAHGDLAMAAGALVAVLLPSAPVFGGPMLAGQAEPLMAPRCALGAMLCMQRREGAWAAGFLLGAAACLKLVALALFPAVLFFAPTRRHAGWILAGILLPIAACTLGLALAGTLDEAVAAVVQYPRAYAAEMVSRTALLSLAARGATRLGRGLPLIMVLAAIGLAGVRRATSLARPVLVWIACASAAVLAQRQMTGYHLFLLAPALARRQVSGCKRSRRSHGAFLRRVASSRRRWALHSPSSCWCRKCPCGCVTIARTCGSTPAGSIQESSCNNSVARDRPGTSRRCWSSRCGLGSAMAIAFSSGVWRRPVYAQSGCLPFARWAFHQTLLVEGSPLARRWPDAGARRKELLRDWAAAPPRFTVIVRGDRSGVEPQDSAEELLGFEPLARILATDYAPLHETKSYTLLERRAP